MKQVFRLGILFMLAVGMVLLLFSCDPVATFGEGSLVVQLRSSVRNLNWEPDLDMDIASYTISGVGPGALDSFVVGDHTEDLFTRDGLAVGVWEVTVDGYNGDGAKVATTTASMTIRKSRTTAQSVVLRPLPGTGTLNVSVTWTDSQQILADPGVQVVLRDEEGNDIEGISDPVVLDVDGQAAVAGVTGLPTGWYEVTVGLRESIPGGDPEVVWMGVFALRIVKDQETSGVVVISEEQISLGTGAGTASITIGEEMQNSMPVSFTGLPESVEAGVMVVVSSTGTYSGDEEYRWYVNGVRQIEQTTSVFSHTFTDKGVHLVSLLVFDQGALSGYGQSVTVTDYAVGGLRPAGVYVFYDKGSYSDGWRYLEAAPAGWSGFPEDPFYDFGYYRTTSTDPNQVVGTGTVIGTGSMNTAALTAAMGSTAYCSQTGTEISAYAAKICEDYTGGGYDDWFLPSKDELNLMYQNLKLQDLGDFSSVYYWSSSESGAYGAWGQDFNDGSQYDDVRYGRSRVRPARAF